MPIPDKILRITMVDEPEHTKVVRCRLNTDTEIAQSPEFKYHIQIRSTRTDVITSIFNFFKREQPTTRMTHYYGDGYDWCKVEDDKLCPIHDTFMVLMLHSTILKWDNAFNDM